MKFAHAPKNEWNYFSARSYAFMARKAPYGVHCHTATFMLVQYTVTYAKSAEQKIFNVFRRKVLERISRNKLLLKIFPACATQHLVKATHSSTL
jgi:hypothetical protein